MEFLFGVSRDGISFGGGTAISDYVHGKNVERIYVLERAEFNSITQMEHTLYLVQETAGISIYFGTQTEAAVHPSVACTKAEYDAMEAHDPYTYYNIIDG